MSAKHLRQPWLVAAVVAGAVLLIAACGGAERDDAGTIVEGGNLSVFSFHVGDCFNGLVEQPEVGSVAAVPCNEPHDAEVYHLFDHDGDDNATYPGSAALSAYAVGPCISAFASYVGIDYAVSEIYATAMTPLVRSWEDGDREIVCVLGYQDRRLISESLRGVAR